MCTISRERGRRRPPTPPASTTIYIGNTYEVTDGSATEHIFAGNRRIASKTVSGITYYHPDHLGGLNGRQEEGKRRAERFLLPVRRDEGKYRQCRFALQVHRQGDRP